MLDVCVVNGNGMSCSFNWEFGSGLSRLLHMIAILLSMRRHNNRIEPVGEFLY